METIRYYKTGLDSNGNHREYSVYKEGDLFVSHCHEWTAVSDSTARGTVLEHEEYRTEDDSIKKYDNYLCRIGGSGRKITRPGRVSGVLFRP